jgi:transketolase
MRPADANEVSQAWKAALLNAHGPTVLALTRQNLPTYDRSAPGMGAADGVLKGGYVLFERADSGLQVVLIGTGSEVDIAYQAALKLADAGVGVRVVSLPSWELFEQQDDAYRASVLPPAVPKVSIEAGTTFGWSRWVGNDPARGVAIGIDHFGASAPFQRLYQEFGLTPDHVVAAARKLL